MAHLTNMHKPIPPGGNIKEALAEKAPKNRPGQRGGRMHHPGGILRQEEEKVRFVASAWVPGGYAQRAGDRLAAHKGYKEVGVGEVGGRGGGVDKMPHMGFKPDYHRYKAHEGQDAAVKPSQGVGLIREKNGNANAPFVGVYGVRADRLDAWEMKKPAGAEVWIPKYPKRIVPHAVGRDLPQGHQRVGPDVVGPRVEFRERRIDLRGHARGHEHIPIERIGIFPREGPSPQLCAQRHAAARPPDIEDASRANPLPLNDRRMFAVMRAWNALGGEMSGKVPLEKVLGTMRVQPFRKGMDQWRRDDVPTLAMDDLTEHLATQLVCLFKAEAKDVRVASAFTPSQCGHPSRNGHASGNIRMKEFVRCYERVGCMVFDDSLFEEMVEEAWGLPPMVEQPGKAEYGY